MLPAPAQKTAILLGFPLIILAMSVAGGMFRRYSPKRKE
jgi:hypothetical protein